jgi:hypothetical protein
MIVTNNTTNPKPRRGDMIKPFITKSEMVPVMGNYSTFSVNFWVIRMLIYVDFHLIPMYPTVG